MGSIGMRGIGMACGRGPSEEATDAAGLREIDAAEFEAVEGGAVPVAIAVAAAVGAAAVGVVVGGFTAGVIAGNVMKS